LDPYGDESAWSLLDAAPDATLVVAADGRIVFANGHAGDLFGHQPGQLLQHTVEDLLPASFRQVHRAHRTRYRAEPVNRSMGEGLELHALRSDGTEFPVEVSLNPLSLGDELHVIAAVRDITARVTAEEHLHRVIQALDASEDAVLIFDAATLRYSFVNEGACRLLGYSEQELLAMTPLHVNPSATESEYRSLVEELTSGQATALFRRSTLIRRDGSEVPVEKTIRAAPVARDGSEWVVVLARDISRRLEAEAELEASRSALEQAQRVLAVTEDRERIARDLHDSVIQRLFAESLRLQSTLGRLEDQEQTRTRIESAVDALDATITEIRAAIFSLHTAQLATSTGGLRAQLLEVVETSTATLDFRPLVRFDGKVEMIDDRTAEQMVPVLREGLMNVVKHAGADDVHVTVEVGDEVVITITDDGSGVPDRPDPGHGLRNLDDRARTLGGSFHLDRSGPGTTIRWAVPFRRPNCEPDDG
jgi:PAS domain S-box-containing protein